jgi:hypothetical protein
MLAQVEHPRRPRVVEGDTLDWGWFPDWTGETVVIVASGPSAGKVDLNLTRGRARVIAVNSSYRLVPWRDMVYGCDAQWWHSVEGMPDWPGLRVSQDKRAFDAYPWLKRVVSMRGVQHTQLEQRGYVLWGGNSGSQAINLAAQTGARRIVLCGFDMTLSNGHHWHGKHQGPLSNPREFNVELWRRRTDSMGEYLIGLGYECFNCSPGTALKRWPQVDLEAALDL